MADYYAILKRAVAGLPDSNREKRQAIYDKARKALLAQLQNMDPPLAPAEISKQRMALEEAVRSVERDLDLEASQAPDPQASKTAPVVEAGPKAPSDEKERAASAEPSKTVESATKEAARAKEEAPTDPVVRRAGKDVLKNAVRDANALGAATNAAVKSAQDAADAVGEKREGDVARIEPTLGDTVVKDVRTYQRDASPSVAKPDDKNALDEDEPKGHFGLIAGGLILVGVLAGSGYLLYENREAFFGSEVVVSQTQTDGSQTETPSGQAGADTTDEAEADIPAKEVRTVTVAPPSQDTETQSSDPASETTEPPSSDAASSGEQDSAAAQQPTADEAEAVQSSEQSGDAVAVAQQSILYEEEGPNGEQGSASPGEVVWSLEGEGEATAIVATASIPDQKLTIETRISLNKDADLPASHLIEITLIRQEADPSRSVSSIPGLIMKPTEQSRGEGLVGAAIRISDDMHWIALTSGEREIKYNQELLLLRSWIDMPIQYETGRRAILTLEKGAAGDRIVEQALEAWKG